jgi:hypothetical protein
MGYRDGALSLEERLASQNRERERLHTELAMLDLAITDAALVEERRHSELTRVLEWMERAYRGLTRRALATGFSIAMLLVLGAGMFSALHVRALAREKLRREMVTDERYRSAAVLELACLDGASGGLEANVSLVVTEAGTVESARVRTRARAVEDESSGRNECLEGALRSRTFAAGRGALRVSATLRLAPREGVLR